MSPKSNEIYEINNILSQGGVRQSTQGSHAPGAIIHHPIINSNKNDRKLSIKIEDKNYFLKKSKPGSKEKDSLKKWVKYENSKGTHFLILFI